MADKTGISWTDATWNPVRGCSRVSEGCRNCYAESVAARFSGPGQAYEGLAIRKLIVANADEKDPGNRSVGRWTGVVRLIPDHLADPLRWKRPRRIFVNSMSDLFHESLTNEQIAAVFGVMAAAPQHTFQVLTKRAKRMREWFEWLEGHGFSTCMREATQHLFGDGYNTERLANWWRDQNMCVEWPRRNIWLGVSVENQDAADERIPELLETPAAVRFLSCEPLLGPVDISEYFDPCSVPCGEAPWPELDWVIAGCESGHGARPCDVAWLRSLRDQCASARVAFFLKQATNPVIEIAPGVRDREDVIQIGRDSKRKARGVIELPYLDGVQHAAFPGVHP